MPDTILVNKLEVKRITGKLRGKKKDADDLLHSMSNEIETARQFFEGESFKSYEREFDELTKHIQKSLYACLDNIADTMEKATGSLIEADKQVAGKIHSYPALNKSNAMLGKVGSGFCAIGPASLSNNKGFSVMGMLKDVFGTNKGKSDSWKSGEKEFHPINGVTINTKGNLLGYNATLKHNVGFDLKKGEVGASINGKLEGYVAKGEVSGKVGIGTVTLSGTALTASVSGEAKAVLFDAGKLDPQLKLKASAEAVGLKGSLNEKIGNDKFNIHQGADGYVGVASAEASASIGKDGLGAKVGADASVFKGEVKQGFTLFGVSVDVSAQGEAISAGASAEFGVQQNSFNVGGKLSALVGLGLKLKISW